MKRSIWQWGGSDASTAAHSVQLDMRGTRAWAAALMGLASTSHGVYRDVLPPAVGRLNPLGARSPQRAQATWAQQSAAPNSRIQPVPVAFVQNVPSARNISNLPTIGPVDTSAQQAQALRAKILASMGAGAPSQ